MSHLHNTTNNKPDNALSIVIGCSLVFSIASLTSAIKVLSVAQNSGSFNPDCYTAIGFARHFLSDSNKSGQIFDLYTHGFIHVFMYIPIVWLLETLKVPVPLQDPLGISIMYSFVVASIVCLTFIFLKSQSLPNTMSLPLSFIVLIMFLTKNSHDHDMISPNAELIGAVFLLGLSITLTSSKASTLWVGPLVASLAFHLKYQFTPLIVVLLMFSKLKIGIKIKQILLLIVFVLGIDILAYRLNGQGFLFRCLQLLHNYSNLKVEDPSLFSRLHNIPDIALHLPLLPFFIVSLLSLNLYFVCTRSKTIATKLAKDNAFIALLVCSALLAIVIPGKGFTHYVWLLLLPLIVALQKLAYWFSYLYKNEHLRCH